MSGVIAEVYYLLMLWLEKLAELRIKNFAIFTYPE
jgi:hypothetical protein